MSLLIFFNMLGRTGLISSIAAAIAVIGCVIVGLDHGFPVHYDINRVVHYFLGQTGSRLIICFLLGIISFQHRNAIPYSKRLAAACFVWCLALAIFIKAGSIMASCAMMNVLAAAPLTYLMAFIGVSRIPKIPVLHRGDYSYGIYLYGFPIQQMAFALLPGDKSPMNNFVASFPFIIGFAMFSWHCIEKPILKLRSNFSFVAKDRLVETPQRESDVVPMGTLAGQGRA
jgi:peptidoglycan/LPS O-acetylase OafA/YrhL